MLAMTESWISLLLRAKKSWGVETGNELVQPPGPGNVHTSTIGARRCEDFRRVPLHFYDFVIITPRSHTIYHPFADFARLVSFHHR